MFWNQKKISIHVGNLPQKTNEVMGATVYVEHYEKYKHHSVVLVGIAVKSFGDLYSKKVGNALARAGFHSTGGVRVNQPGFRWVPIVVPNSLMSDNVFQSFILANLYTAFSIKALSMDKSVGFNPHEINYEKVFESVLDGDIPQNLFAVNAHMMYTLLNDYRFSLPDFKRDGNIFEMIEEKITEQRRTIGVDAFPNNDLSHFVSNIGILDILINIWNHLEVKEENFRQVDKMKQLNKALKFYSIVKMNQRATKSFNYLSHI